MKKNIIFLYFALSICITSPVLSQTDSTISKADTLLANEYAKKVGAFRRSGQYDSTLYYTEQVAKIYYKLALKYDEKKYWSRYVNSLSSYGNILRYLGKYEEAMNDYLKPALALGLEKLEDDDIVIAYVYNNIGLVYNKTGFLDEACEYYGKSLALKIKLLGEINGSVANTYNNIGVLLLSKTDYDRALEYVNKALGIRLELYGNDDIKVGNCYNNLGAIYDYKRNFDQVILYSNKALEIKQKVYGENHPKIAAIYNNIGVAYKDKGDFSKALEYHEKSLAIKSATLEKNHPEFRFSYFNMGAVYFSMGDYQTAREYYRKSLDILIKNFGFKSPHTAHSFNAIGSTYLEQASYDSAFYYLQKALQAVVPDFNDDNIFTNPRITNATSDDYLLDAFNWKAKGFRDFYSVTTNVADLKMALDTYELAADLVDKMRDDYSAEGSKLTLGENVTGLFEQAIETALTLHKTTQQREHLERAFMFTERAKSSVLLNSLMDVQAQQFAGIPDSLIQLEKTLKIKRAFYETQLQLELENSKNPDSLKIKEYESKTFALGIQYNDLIQHFEQKYPGYYNLKYQTRVVSVAELQQELDDKSAVLNYFVGDSTIYTFVVTKNNINFEIQPIDSTFYPTVENAVASIKKVDSQAYLKTSRQLYQQLIKPIEKHLKSVEKLTIIPHGVLYTIPFEALLVQTGSGKFAQLDYLIKHYNISYHYSATLYLNIQNEFKNDKSGPEPLSFLGFAPVFSDDKQSSYLAEKNEHQIEALLADSNTRALYLDGKKFSELKHSETEVKQIISLLKRRGKHTLGYFHSDASEQNFKSHVGEFDIIHIATHGIINEDRPQLSGIIFSQPMDSAAPGKLSGNSKSDSGCPINGRIPGVGERLNDLHQTPGISPLAGGSTTGVFGQSSEDGVLYSSETYNLDLQADLVVLSSCESGIGKLVKGEGMMALTRGFMYSGASNILVSLWKVSDKQTSQLMIDFYKAINQQPDYSESLRQAKLKMIKNEATAFPKSWSSFVLIGR